MRGRPYALRENDLFCWHRWFAWRPVTVTMPDGRLCRVWWEYVERKLQEGVYYSPYGGSTAGWVYRVAS